MFWYYKYKTPYSFRAEIQHYEVQIPSYCLIPTESTNFVSSRSGTYKNSSEYKVTIVTYKLCTIFTWLNAAPLIVTAIK